MISFKLASVTSLTYTCSLASKSSNLDGNTITCTRGSDTKYFYIDNPFLTNILPRWDYNTATDSTTISFKITGATNPVSAGDGGTWKITTYNLISGTRYEVNTGTSTTSLTPIAGVLAASGTGISSKVSNILLIILASCYNFASLITYSVSGTLTFKISLGHSIPASGFVIITLPSELSISSTSSIRSSCYYGASKVS